MIPHQLLNTNFTCGHFLSEMHSHDNFNNWYQVMIARLIDLFAWFIDELVDWLIEWMNWIGCLIDWLIHVRIFCFKIQSNVFTILCLFVDFGAMCMLLIVESKQVFILAHRSCPLTRLGGSILAPRETILAPREHPGRPFCLFGTTLEDHGSSRMDTTWSGTGFPSILNWFVERILTVF